jgi:hypothetical protein
MMLSCLDTTRLASEALERRLSIGQRMQVGLHMMMCGPCRRARRMMLFLRRAAERLPEESSLNHEQHLSQQGRQRIVAALRGEPPATGSQPEQP